MQLHLVAEKAFHNWKMRIHQCAVYWILTIAVFSLHHFIKLVAYRLSNHE